MRRSMVHKLAALMFAPWLMIACTTSYSIPKGGDLGQAEFKTSSKVAPGEISLNKPFAGIDDIQFVVFASGCFNFEIQCDTYWKEALRQLGFPKVINTTEYQQLLISSGITAKESIADPFNLVGLNTASRHLPPFLVVRYVDMWLGGAWHRQVMNVVDPAAAAPLYQLDRRTFILASFDGELTYPATNEFRNWVLKSREEAKKNPGKRKDSKKDTI